MKKIFNRKALIALALSVLMLCPMLMGCEMPEPDGSEKDTQATLQAGDTLQTNQPTPTDIDYSLERYNLIKRTYWVNGQHEKARSVPCAITRPLGYCILVTESGAILGQFEVDGKVSSLNSYLTPDSEYYEQAVSSTNGGSRQNEWLPDVDGSYGENDSGIFFFTPDGNYIEWTGTYLYSDIPFTIDTPVINIKGE